MVVSIPALKQWYHDHRDEVLRDYFTFLSFPSISTDPSHIPDSRNTAEWLKAYLQRIGCETVLWETPGLPVVFGSYCHAGSHRPTLLIYHHYDVQPVDPLNLWKSDPFKPEVRNNQVYARGALDNKGQCFYSLTALRACLELSKKLDLNVKVFIEGEEESGGKGTTAILKERQAELHADHLLVVDFDIPDSKTPAVTLGMRGIITMDVECSNSSIDLHSGVHGGIALNPNRALATLLGNLWDESGKVNIPHFYDDVQPFPREQLSRLDMRFDQESYERSFGVKAYAMEPGFSILESNWLRPSLEINGMSGGYTGPGFKTVIPAKAHAKISCRLVPNQDPSLVGKRIAEFLQSRAPQGIVVTVKEHHGAQSYRSSVDSSIVHAVAHAFEEVFNQPCRFQLCGASVPIVVDLSQASGAEVAMIGVGLVDDDIHAPNEHFGLDRFELGYLTMGRILSRLAGETA